MRVTPHPGNGPNVAEMFKQIRAMPPGTVGFEEVGEIDDDDFADVVEPVLRQRIASGHKLRLLYLLGPQLREYEGDAAQEQLKFAARHISAQRWAEPALIGHHTSRRQPRRICRQMVPARCRLSCLSML